MGKLVYLNVVSGELTDHIADYHIAVTFCPKKDYEQVKGGLYDAVLHQRIKGMSTAFEGHLNLPPPTSLNIMGKLYDDAFSAMTNCSTFARKKGCRINVLFDATSRDFGKTDVAALTLLQGVLKQLSNRRQLRSFQKVSLFVRTPECKAKIENALRKAAGACGLRMKHDKVVLRHKENARQLHNAFPYPFMQKRNISERLFRRIFARKIGQQANGEPLYEKAHSSSGDTDETTVADSEDFETDKEEMDEEKTIEDQEEEEDEDLSHHQVSFIARLKENCNLHHVHYLNQMSFGEPIEHWGEKLILNHHTWKLTDNDNIREYSFQQRGENVKRWVGQQILTCKGAAEKERRVFGTYKAGERLNQYVASLDHRHIIVGTTLMENVNLPVTENTSAVVAGILSHLMDPNVFVNIAEYVLLVDTEKELQEVNELFIKLADKLNIECFDGNVYLYNTEECRKFHNILVKPIKRIDKLWKPQGKKWIAHNKPLEQIPRKGEILSNPFSQMESPRDEDDDSSPTNGQEEPMAIDHVGLPHVATQGGLADDLSASHIVHFQVATKDRADHRYAHFVNQISHNTGQDHPCEDAFREHFSKQMSTRGKDIFVHEYNFDFYGKPVKRWFGNTHIKCQGADTFTNEEDRIFCAYYGALCLMKEVENLDVHNLYLSTTVLEKSKLSLIRNVASVVAGILISLMDPRMFVNISTVSISVDTEGERKEVQDFFDRLAATHSLLTINDGQFLLENTKECRLLHNALVREFNQEARMPEIPLPTGDDWVQHATPFEQVPRKGEKLQGPYYQLSKSAQVDFNNSEFDNLVAVPNNSSPTDRETSDTIRTSNTTPYSSSKVAEWKRNSRRYAAKRSIHSNRSNIVINDDLWDLPGIESLPKGYDEETTCKNCRALRYPVGQRCSCCQNGKVILNEWRLPPRIFFDLLNGTHPKSTHFKENIITYCTLLGFASIQRQHMEPDPYGPQPVKNMGQMYTMSSSLYPLDPQKPTFAHLYVLDSKKASQKRKETATTYLNNPNIDVELLEELADVIAKYNCFAFAYRSFDEVIKEKRARNEPEKKIYMRLLDRYEIPKDHPTHAGCLNIPRIGDAINIIYDSVTDEAFKFPNYDSFPRDLTDRRERMKTMALNNIPIPRGLGVFQQRRRRDEERGVAPIPSWSPIGEPMAYVLLSPYGDFLFNPKGSYQSPKGSTNDDYDKTDPECIRNLNEDASNYPDDDRSRLVALSEQTSVVNSSTRTDDDEDGLDQDDDIDPINANDGEDRIEEFLRNMQEESAVDDRDIMPVYAFIDNDGETIPLRKNTSHREGTTRFARKGFDFDPDDPNFSDMSGDEDEVPSMQSHEHSPGCTHHNPSRSIDSLSFSPEPDSDLQAPNSSSQQNMTNDSDTEMMDVDSSSSEDGLSDADEHFTAEQFDRKAASRRESLAYRLHTRIWNVMHNFHPLISSRKLGQMYIIDQVMRMLDDQCSYIRKKRTVKLSNNKSRVAEYLNRAAARRNISIGTMTTMPSTFQGSPRWYRELYEKAIALMNRIGKPDLFITFTGNSKWKEIENNLIKSTCWCDNTALVCQVFWKKFNEFLDDILGKKNRQMKRPMEGIFGKVRGFVYSVKFQKRGMPHVHMLVTLDEKLDTSEKIDAVIKGELPVITEDMSDEEKEKIHRLRALVERLMMHKPCDSGKNDYCRKNVPRHWKQCQKRFPKPFVPVTSITEDGYATHKRRPSADGGDDANQWVVPYNPYLIEKYQSHINVEMCASVHSAKYIFKYIFKGVDRVLMEMVEGMDTQNVPRMSANKHIIHPKGVKLSAEVMRHLEEEAKKTLAQHGIAPRDSNGNRVVVYDESLLWKELRLLTATEATWKTLELPMHGSSHFVQPLYVHEEDKEQIFLDEDADIADVRKQVNEVRSKMTAYFEIMRRNHDPELRLTYDEMPLKYRFLKNKWVRRRYKKENIIGHIKAIQPRFLQLFALRELAKVVKGATTFDDYLQDDDGNVHTSFAECARARRLLDGETEWARAMRDAITIDTPKMVRRTFSQILIFGCPKQPLQLWEEFKDEMFDRWRMTDEQKIARALFHIQSYLRLHGKELSEYGLPSIDLDALNSSRHNPLDDEAEELAFTVEDSERISKEMEAELNEDQKEAVRKITECINNGGGDSFFLDGSGGTGKTYVYKYLYHKMNSLGRKVEMVAHTGIAATLLINGSTAHGKFRIPLNLDENEFSGIDVDKSKKRAHDLRHLDAIVWDEATMSDWRMFRCVDTLLKKIRGNNLPFGGVCLIAGGDWKQLLPVSNGSSPINAKNLALKGSPLWNCFETIKLNKNMRAAQDPEFAAYLEDVGHGSSFSQNEFHQVAIPEKMICPSLDTVIEELFPRNEMSDVQKMKGVCLLTVRNVDALTFNDKIIGRLDGAARLYKSMDRPVEEKSLIAIPPETFHNQTPNGLPPHVLKLKVGCIVMLLRNLNVKRGLCNGTKLKVLKMMNDLLLCESIPVHNEDSPQKVQLFRMPMVSTTRPGEFQFQRTQFPIRLAYCLTINKSQGQTLEKIGIALKTPVFSHGHMYVALSRAKNSDSVLFFSEKAASDKAAGIRHFTQNIVYRDMISNVSREMRLNNLLGEDSISTDTLLTQVSKNNNPSRTGQKTAATGITTQVTPLRGDLLLENRHTDCFLIVMVQMCRACPEIRNTVFSRGNETWKELSRLCNSVGTQKVDKLRTLIGMDDKVHHDAHESFWRLAWALREKEAAHFTAKAQTHLKCGACGEERIISDQALGVLELSSTTDTAESITSLYNEYVTWTDDVERTCMNCQPSSSSEQTLHQTRNQYDFEINQALCVALPLLSARGEKRKFTLTKQQTVFEMGGYKWEIISVAKHIGNSSADGHYVCYIKQQNSWRLYDDDKAPITVRNLPKNYLSVACVMLRKCIPQ